MTHVLRSERRWLVGSRVQLRVVAALMIRDAVSTYGHENLGFFWIIGEPLLLTGGIMLLWSLAHLTHGSDVGVIPFALTSYSFVTLWRHIVFRSVRVMTRNAALIYHRHIKYIDAMFATMILETVAIFAAFIVIYIPMLLLGLCPLMNDPLSLVGGFFFTAWFSFAFGLILTGLSEISEPMHHFINPIMYITMPLTGIFFMVAWLPSNLQQLMLWSPLVNAVEMIRHGLFPAEYETYFSVSYLFTSCLVLTAIGLPLCRFAEKHIEIR